MYRRVGGNPLAGHEPHILAHHIAQRDLPDQAPALAVVTTQVLCHKLEQSAVPAPDMSSLAVVEDRDERPESPPPAPSACSTSTDSAAPKTTGPPGPLGSRVACS